MKNLDIASKMKFKTAKNIDECIGLNRGVLEKLSDASSVELSKFVQGHKHDRLQRGTKNLFHKAAELMVIMMRSRAIFSIDEGCLYRPQGPLPFDSSSMEIQFSDY